MSTLNSQLCQFVSTFGGLAVIALLAGGCGSAESDFQPADSEGANDAAPRGDEVRRVEQAVVNANVPELPLLTASDGQTGDQFGYSAAVDGNTMVIGAYYDDDNGLNSGSAYVFEYINGAWTETAKLLPSNGGQENWFGFSVDVSEDTVVVGEPKDDEQATSSGAVYVYDKSSGNWTFKQKLLASNGKFGARLGSAVSIDGTTLIAGAKYRDDFGTAYVFDNTGGTWIENTQLSPIGLKLYDDLGTSVALDGDVAVLGAPGDDTMASEAGAAYVYRRDSNGVWHEDAKLTVSNAAADAEFGAAVSVAGSTVAVASAQNPSVGAVQLYEDPGNGWAETTQLVGSDSVNFDLFGGSISMATDRIVVGAKYDDDNGNFSGSAYLFERSGGVWTEATKLVPANGDTSNLLGSAVATDGKHIISTATDADGAAFGSGLARVYEILHTSAPNAHDLHVALDEDSQTGVALRASDPDGDTLTFSLQAGPSNGTTSGFDATTGQLTYTPDADFFGTDTLTFKVNDGTADSNVATVTLEVVGTNDPPEAIDDTATTDEDVATTIDVLASDVDIDQDTLAVVSVTQPANGTVTNSGTEVTYTPNSEFSGTDTFDYTMSDGNGGTDTATVTVTVDNVNDSPEATHDAATTLEDTQVVIDVLQNDSDPEGDVLSLVSTTQPANGATTISGTSVTYTPDADFNGTDSFDYAVSDGNSSSVGTVTVTVDPVQDPPVAEDDEATTDEDTPVDVDVLRNDSDVDADVLTASLDSQPTNGTTTLTNGTVSYTPNPDFNGTDSFGYTVSDGNGGSDAATVTVTIEPVNDAPVAEDDTASTDEDSAVLIDVLQNDSDTDGDALSVTVQSSPQNGEATVEGLSIRYVPEANFFGEDQFDYEVSDSEGGSAAATVHVTVNEANSAPVFVAPTPSDGAQLTVDTEDTFAFSLAAEDPDGDELAFAIEPLPSDASFDDSSGEFSWRPSDDAVGEHALSISASDGRLSATRSLTIVVNERVPEDEDAGNTPDAGHDAGQTDDDVSPDRSADRQEPGGCTSAPTGAAPSSLLVVLACILVARVRGVRRAVVACCSSSLDARWSKCFIKRIMQAVRFNSCIALLFIAAFIGCDSRNPASSSGTSRDASKILRSCDKAPLESDDWHIATKVPPLGPAVFVGSRSFAMSEPMRETEFTYALSSCLDDLDYEGPPGTCFVMDVSHGDQELQIELSPVQPSHSELLRCFRSELNARETSILERAAPFSAVVLYKHSIRCTFDYGLDCSGERLKHR